MNLALTLTVIWGIIFFYGIVLYHKAFNPQNDNWYHILALVIWIFTFLVPFKIYTDFSETIVYEEEKHEWYIKSLGNDKYLNGDFFLGSGTVEETDYYFFYVETSNGFQRLKIPIYKTYIIETNNRTPEYVKVYDRYDDKDTFWKILFDDEKFNRLYVPKNTIIRDFKVR